MPDPTQYEEFATFSKLATPTIVSCFFACLPATINVVFAGHLDDPAKIAAVGLGNICLFMFCFTLLTGLNSAQESLIMRVQLLSNREQLSSRDLRQCGLILNIGRIISTAFFIPLAVLLCFADKILFAVG